MVMLMNQIRSRMIAQIQAKIDEAKMDKIGRGRDREGEAMIEPMTIEEIKREVAQIDWRFVLEPHARSYKEARRWMAWAHERARGNHYLHEMCHNQDRSHPNFGRSDSDWLNEVLDEIGWPKESR